MLSAAVGDLAFMLSDMILNSGMYPLDILDVFFQTYPDIFCVRSGRHLLSVSRLATTMDCHTVTSTSHRRMVSCSPSLCLYSMNAQPQY